MRVDSLRESGRGGSKDNRILALRSTCLSDSTIADDDTLHCLHLVLNFSVTASAAWDGGQTW